MSVPATFDSVFVQACRATSKGAAADVVIADADAPGLSLVVCGSSDGAFVFSNAGVHFNDPKGLAVSYSWQDLDFILPGDLSLAKDKLDTFTDVDVVAGKVARAAGYVAAVAAVAFLGIGVVDIIYGVFAPPIIWLHVHLGTFGDIVSLMGLVLLGSAIAPFAIPILLGLLASGGIIAAIGTWLGRQVRPLVRWGLAMSFGSFPNGILVIQSRWVKLPWGTPTTLLRDFIMVGVKLRRRGLT